MYIYDLKILTIIMDSKTLSEVCDDAIDQNKYVSLVHRYIKRDVYPYEIKGGKLYCWCSIHPDAEVEGMYLTNITKADVSDKEIGFLFPYRTEFGTK